MSELYYPTIDLFIYDLKNALNSDATEIAQNTQNFLAKLPQNIQFQDIEQESEYLELATPERPDLNPNNTALSGYYYPVRLNDTYGLQIDCSINNLIEAQPLDSFALIKAEIEQKTKTDRLTIGQTWLVSGWLTEHFESDPEAIAQQCYQNLFKEGDWQQELYGKGTFLKGFFFELWQSQSYPNRHVIITLFPNREMAEKAANFYTDWMGLFCYWHKITWAYHQSRIVKEALVNHYRKVEENTRIIKNVDRASTSVSNLPKLFNNIQNILNQYTVDLLNLSFQKQIIEINLENYQTRTAIIKKKAGEESDLNCLDRFSYLVEKKYLAQIDRDTENMQLGLRLLEDNISALRSRIELEKAERDRIFQTLVTIIGTGTAGAALVGAEEKKCEAFFLKDSFFCTTPIVKSVIVPMLLIIGFGILGWAFKKWLLRSQ